MATTTKTKKLTIPVFASRDEEAAWYYKNRARVEAEISRRIKSGDVKSLAQALGASSEKPPAKLTPITIRMPADDLSTARRLAERKGMPYQTYLKVLLRDALQRDALAAG